jgi:hypothetical protein
MRLKQRLWGVGARTRLMFGVQFGEGGAWGTKDKTWVVTLLKV